MCTDAGFMVRELGIGVNPTVLSDQNNGRTDRVVVEWELHGLSEAMAVDRKVERCSDNLTPASTDPDIRLTGLIEYSLPENAK